MVSGLDNPEHLAYNWDMADPTILIVYVFAATFFIVWSMIRQYRFRQQILATIIHSLAVEAFLNMPVSAANDFIFERSCGHVHSELKRNGIRVKDKTVQELVQNALNQFYEPEQ